jgi:hypothetical protein
VLARTWRGGRAEAEVVYDAGRDRCVEVSKPDLTDTCVSWRPQTVRLSSNSGRRARSPQCKKVTAIRARRGASRPASARRPHAARTARSPRPATGRRVRRNAPAESSAPSWPALDGSFGRRPCGCWSRSPSKTCRRGITRFRGPPSSVGQYRSERLCCDSLRGRPVGRTRPGSVDRSRPRRRAIQSKTRSTRRSEAS